MNENEHGKPALEVAAQSVSTQAIRKFRQPMIEYLQSGLEDNDKWVQVMAAEMLGFVGDHASANRLKMLLATRDKDLRTAAARSLAMIHSPAMAFSLNRVDKCETCMIRLVADEALERLKDVNEITRNL
jgi:HEAT repeat protein